MQVARPRQKISGDDNRRSCRINIRRASSIDEDRGDFGMVIRIVSALVAVVIAIPVIALLGPKMSAPVVETLEGGALWVLGMNYEAMRALGAAEGTQGMGMAIGITLLQVCLVLLLISLAVSSLYKRRASRRQPEHL
ncbi:hypothetical protein ACC808_10575 [Rhizobium ruizarguesonis]